jgi:hypothetical protein
VTGIRLLAVSCIRKKLSSYCSSKLYTQIQYLFHIEHSLNYRDQALKNLYRKITAIMKTIQNIRIHFMGKIQVVVNVKQCCHKVTTDLREFE